MTFPILDFGFSISGDVAQAEHDLRLRQSKTAAQQEIEDAIVSQGKGLGCRVREELRIPGT
jgi:hypothetical protein